MIKVFEVMEDLNPLSPFRTFLKRAQELLTLLFPLSIIFGKSPPDIIAGLGAFFFLVECFVSKRWKWLKEPFFVLMILFWGLMIGRSFFALHMKDSFLAALPWGRYILLTAMMTHVSLQSAFVRRTLPLTLLSTCVFLMLDGLLQYITGQDFFGRPAFDYVSLTNYSRLPGPFSGPRLGHTLSWLLFPAFIPYIFKKHQTKTNIFLYSLLFYLSCCIVLLSADRTPTFLVGLGILVTLFVFRRIWAYIMFGIGCLCFVLYAQMLTKQTAPTPMEQTTARVMEKMPALRRTIGYTSENLKNFSSNGYFYAFKQAALHTKESFLFGKGMGQFRHLKQLSKTQLLHSHNTFLEVLSSLGATGFLVFLGLMFLPILWTFQKGKEALQNPLIFALLLTFVLRLCPLVGTMDLFSNVAGTPFWFMTAWLIYELRYKKQSSVIS